MKKIFGTFSTTLRIFGIKAGIVYCKWYRKDWISAPKVGFVNEKRRKTFLLQRT
jgi:hypothetical protein